ncbi:hypothetical protein ACLUUI_15180 [Enterobacterales bacterium AW_CKDN230030176-1A_HGKHYDSX7]
MTDSYISRATSSPACNARIPRLPVRYAVILHPESMVNFRCIEADVAMQQDIPSLQYAIYYSTKPLPAKQACSLDVETIGTPWHNRLHWTPSKCSATQKKAQISAVEFPVLLPGLLVGISPLPRHIEAFSQPDCALQEHVVHSAFCEC